MKIQLTRQSTLSALLLVAGLTASAGAQGGTHNPPAAPAPKEAAPAATNPGTEGKTDQTDPHAPRDVSQYNLEKGKPAIQGYDPVAYFPEGGGQPKKGDAKFAYTYRGVVYHFASEKNRDAFKAAPAKFEPAYGGWCAYACSQDDKVEIDPKSFKITDGRLYLFYKDFLNDTRAKWTKEEAKLQPKADSYWKKIAKEEPPMKPDAAKTPAGSPKGG